MEKKLQNISWGLQFIDSARFLAKHITWKIIANLVNNLSQGTHKIKCKYGHDDKICETCGITYKICDHFLEYTNLKDNFIEYKCLCCNKNY